MDANKYQRLARETEIYSDASTKFLDLAAIDPSSYELHRLLKLLYCTGKLNGEAGEIAEKVFKLLRDGNLTNYYLSNEFRESIHKELGDVLWYISAIADIVGYDLGDIMQANIIKLKDRKDRGVISGSGDNR